MALIRCAAGALLVWALATRAYAGGAVATEHQRAADAGADVLRQGGNVVDAVIAAAAAVCVVHPSSCGVGGGSFALVHLVHGGDQALDFRECAPAGARPERFRTDGKPDATLLRSGGLAVGVPGEVAGWVALHERYGHLPLARVLAPAVALARDGFRLDESPHMRREIERGQKLLQADPGLRATFLAADGSVPPGDFRIVQPDLAKTLEGVGAHGARAFYSGTVAAAIAAAVQARGGVLTVADLAAYKPIWRTPLTGTFRDRRIVTFPPPGSGGVVLTILGQLADDDLPGLAKTPGLLAHFLAGAMAQGFADRARWYGDPAFTDVPLERLLAPARLKALRARLSPTAVVPPETGPVEGAGTAHVSVIDDAGNAAAITTTINTGFGAGIMPPGTGVILNNEMDDFAVAAGVANVYGLYGAEANAVGLGKRPQSSMSPTIVLRDGRPELVVGGSGGPTIISGITQVVLQVTALGTAPAAAVRAPRLHDQGMPPGVAVEPGITPEVRQTLTAIGHPLREMPSLGAVSAVGVATDGTFEPAPDLRKDGGGAIAK